MAYHLVEEKPFIITLPCSVGDTVYCNIDDHKEDYLDECIVGRIEINRDYHEPLFTVLCFKRVGCKNFWQTFWLSDFGKLVITEPTYINMEPDEMAHFIKSIQKQKRRIP